MESRRESLQNQALRLLEQQTKDWKLAANNYNALKKVRKRIIPLAEHINIILEFNPQRKHSTTASVDAQSIRERKCFLCAQNRPQEQKELPLDKDFVILVNPFPIFPEHFTIAHKQHSPQNMAPYLAQMLDMAQEMPNFDLFYNGPKCGASAPDHMHFQAGSKGVMPLISHFAKHAESLYQKPENCKIWTIESHFRYCLVLESTQKRALITKFQEVYQTLQKRTETPTEEPMLNIIASYTHPAWRIFIFPRKAHRPEQYFEQGDTQLLISPASVDFGGILTCVREEDFNKIHAKSIIDIFKQVSCTQETFQFLKEAVIKNY